MQIFLTRLNASEQAAGRLPSGWSYVLPTESQWEYACRAGTTTAYSWGATIASSNAKSGIMDASQPNVNVGQYAANPWGFFDMHGNVWEWTADWYAVYSSGAQTDPTGPASGSLRVNRGGSWSIGGTTLRSARRTNTPELPQQQHRLPCWFQTAVRQGEGIEWIAASGFKETLLAMTKLCTEG